MKLRCGLLLLVLFGSSATIANAQSSAWSPRLQLDNDAYNFWLNPGARTDEQYTNGVVFSLETMRAPWWGARLAPRLPACADPLGRDGRCVATVLAIAQDLYTPNLNRPPYSEPNWESERPYAAWLRVSGTARVISSTELREVEVAGGVTGPPALGKIAQSIAHTISRPYTVKATGWETQVGFEPGLLAAYHQTWLVTRGTLGHGFAYDLAPRAGGTLGNILTEADAGATARVGYDLSHPWDQRAWRGRKQWEAFVSAGAGGQYVLEDFSLDGRLFGGGRHVERVPTVAQHELAAGLRFDRLTLMYRAVTRSREYVTGPGQHTFSSMIASWGGG
ncbi:MAG: lipid A deacylase LpxR family protein [bacterium]